MSRRLTHTSTVSLHACERLSNYHFMSRFANSFVTPDCVAVLFVVDDTIFLTGQPLGDFIGSRMQRLCFTIESDRCRSGYFLSDHFVPSYMTHIFIKRLSCYMTRDKYGHVCKEKSWDRLFVFTCR